ncbi:MAG: hypothetical protein H8E44_42045 [Planctomycetes bacterium]|nr:hypothetical protein [Planctomycetota bacterium]MBL7041920.1 hypothetical protein [Pirellulaceae bacterium]
MAIRREVSSSANGSVERQLSPFEKVIWRLSEAAPLNFSVFCRVSGPLTEPVLRRALVAAQKRHPLCQVRIQQTGQGPGYRTSDVPELPLRVHQADSDQCLEIVEEEINTPIPWDSGPLVRCALIRRSAQLHHVLLTFHHMVGDATSGVYLMRDLIDAAGQAATTDSSVNLPPLADSTPLDHRLPIYTRGFSGFRRTVGLAAGTLLQNARLRRPDWIRPDRDVPPSERRTRVLSRTLEADFSERLRARCRQEKTTIHGALTAAICLQIAHEMDHGRSVSIRHRTAVNVRDILLPTAGEDVGFFASMVFYRGQVSRHDQFWDIARVANGQIKSAIAKGTPADAVRMVPHLYRLLGGDRLSPEKLARLWRKHNPTTTGLTNIGAVKIETQFGAFTIEDMQFAVSPAALGDFTCCCSSLHGRLFWNFMLPEPTFRPERAERLTEEMVARLVDAVSS